MRYDLPGALFLFTGCLLAGAGFAQDDCQAPSPDCVVVGKVNVSLSLGAGVRTNPIESNSDIPLVAIPSISWYGERFFLENLDLGFTLHEGDTDTFNLIATPGYDRVFFYRNDLQNIFVGLGGGEVSPVVNRRVPVRERHMTYLVGPEWTFTRGTFTGQLDALYEVTGRHKGYEVRAAVSSPLGRTRNPLQASAGFTWKSAELVEYYYGVEGVYLPGSTLNPFIKLAWRRPLSERWTLNAFAHYEYLGDDVADSPIVTERGVTTAFVGFLVKLL